MTTPEFIAPPEPSLIRLVATLTLSEDARYRVELPAGETGLAPASREYAIMALPDNLPRGNYVIVFDPLDGSSNIDVNVSVGTTFSILRRPEGAGLDDVEQWLLQPGRKQIAAGYVIYGSSTMLVYTTGNGVNGFG